MMQFLIPTKKSAHRGENSRSIRAGNYKEIIADQRTEIARLQRRSRDSVARLASLLLQKKARDATGERTLSALPHCDLHTLPDMVDIENYLRTICAHLKKTLAKNSSIAFRVRTTNIQVPVEIAMCYGLMVTELCASACARTGDTPGGLFFVRYRVRGARWCFSVSDNHPYVRRDQPSVTFESEMMDLLVRQLNATITRRNNARGTTVLLQSDEIEGLSI